MKKTHKQLTKYCVCAFIDLLGFASHLELGADLRTTIGVQAIKRLQNLEDAIRFLREEWNNSPDSYPLQLDIRRINDAIILMLDLPDVLQPEVGKTIRNSTHDELISEVIKTFDNSEITDEAEFRKRYYSAHTNHTRELWQLIGIVSRLHNFISEREGNQFFPGPKTVISTGMRRPFYTENIEDQLSANFAFSNAYAAESKLKGSGLFVDNNILQLLSFNSFAKTLMRHSLMIRDNQGFDPMQEYDDLPMTPSGWRLSTAHEMELFRRRYIFRPMDPFKASVFQLLPGLLPFLQGESTAKGNDIHTRIINSLQTEFKGDTDPSTYKSLLNYFYFDIEDDIQVVSALIAGTYPKNKKKLAGEYFRRNWSSIFQDFGKYLNEKDQY